MERPLLKSYAGALYYAIFARADHIIPYFNLTCVCISMLCVFASGLRVWVWMLMYGVFVDSAVLELLSLLCICACLLVIDVASFSLLCICVCLLVIVVDEDGKRSHI